MVPSLMEENLFKNHINPLQISITYSPGWNLWEGETLVLKCGVSFLS